jgi:predicted metal-dependent phosphotriesterase family hydrolase
MTDKEDGISVDKLVRAYIKMREKREELTRTYDTEYESISEKMRLVKNALLDQMRSANVESIRTTEGLVYRTMSKKYWTSDWDNFYNFIMEHNIPQVLEKRVHQTNLKEFLESNPDLLPPGLNVDSEYSVTVQRRRN